MAGYLTEEQQAEFERQLAEGELSQEEAEAAIVQGMQMAQAVQQGGEKDALAQSGFGSVEELLTGYEQAQGTISQLKGMLNQLLDMRKAQHTAQALYNRTPDYEVHQQIEMEITPLHEQTEQTMRNRLIQQEWQNSAAEMTGLEQLMPEIAQYILENPKYAQESDGLRRAYDAVRSRKYRDEAELLLDPQFIERMAGNELIREAVMKAHLEEIQRTGGTMKSVGAGSGQTPLSARKNITGMEQAKKRLEAMLGVKG